MFNVLDKQRHYYSAIALLTVLYFLAAKLGLSLSVVGETVTLIWPPSGLALAALLLFGGRLWPGVALGALLVNASTDIPLWTAALIAGGNTLEALAGVYLLRRIDGFQPSLTRTKDVLGLVFLAAGVSTMVSASIGTLGLALAQVIPSHQIGATWLIWWLGDAMGDLVFAPALLVWGGLRQEAWPPRRLLEVLALTGILALAGHTIFGSPLGPANHSYPTAYLAFPFAIWAALRFGQRGAVVAVVLITLFALLGTLRGTGPFGGDLSTLHSLILLCLFASALAITSLALASTLSAQRRAEVRIKHLAHHDTLTGLPNRLLLQDRLDQAIVHAARHQQFAALLFIDLDRFKVINDTLGHAMGDRLLTQVAQRLLTCMRAEDTVARQGGDEFVVVLAQLETPHASTSVADKIEQAFSPPFNFEGYEFHISPSIGISIYPSDGADVETLMKNADVAMYNAKQAGGNRHHYYSEHMNARALERLSLENALRHASERQEFFLHYQPQMDLVSGRVIGVEALARWRHPEMGLVPPDKFIPLAEECGLIDVLGNWVLRQACRQINTWRSAGHRDLRMSVNLSARQFIHGKLHETIGGVLQDCGTPPECLEMEITESVLMQHSGDNVETLAQLHAMGMSIAMDDFGTGYSSLSYLKRFPIDRIKIDRSFIRDLPGDGDDAAITTAIIAMAHSLSMKVIAEGVENAEQLAFLRDLACDEIQGYFLGKPMAAEDCGRFLSEHDQHLADTHNPAPPIKQAH